MHSDLAFCDIRGQISLGFQSSLTPNNFLTKVEYSELVHCRLPEFPKHQGILVVQFSKARVLFTLEFSHQPELSDISDNSEFGQLLKILAEAIQRFQEGYERQNCLISSQIQKTL